MRTGVSWREKLISAVFPARCAICGQVTAGGRRLCSQCEEQSLPKAVFRQIGELSSPDETVFCVSPFVYEGLPKRMDSGFKGLEAKRKMPGYWHSRLVLVLPPQLANSDGCLLGSQCLPRGKREGMTNLS